MIDGPDPGSSSAAAAGAPPQATWVVVLVVAASAVAAVATTGIRLLLPPAGLSGAWVPLVRLAGAAVAAAGVAGLLAQRRRLAQNGARAPDPTAAGLLAAATTMALLTLLALVSPTGSLNRRPAGATDDVATTAPPPETVPNTPSSSAKSMPPSGGFGLGLIRGRRLRGGPGVAGQSPEADTPQASLLRRAGRLLLLALLLAVVFMAIRSFLQRGKEEEEEGAEPQEPEPPVAAEDAAAGLEASLDELAARGRDPRRQITAAYRRLLLALAAAGVPRQPQEAPYEHLRRALGPLRVEPAPMHRLTELYVIAQFSEHPVTETHRAAAAEALAVSLEGLRGMIDDRRPTIDGSFAAGDA